MVGQLQARRDEWPLQSLLSNESDGHTPLAVHAIDSHKPYKQYRISSPFESCGLVPIRCVCSSPPPRPSGTPSRGSISLFWTERSKHAPFCPSYLPSERTVHMGVRLAARLKQLRYLLEARLVWSTRSIATHLECQRVVPIDAPG